MAANLNINARILIIMLASVIQCACTAQYSRELSRETLAATHLTDNYALKRENNWVLPQQSKLSIAYPDVSLLDEDQPITRTQFQLAEQIKIQFTRRFTGAVSQAEPSSLPQAFKNSQQVNADFLLVPQLLTLSASPYAEQSKKNVKNYWQLNFRIYDARSKKLLDVLKMDAAQGMLNRRKQEPAQMFAAGIEQAAQALAGEWGK
ncbi:MAG TPA: hypothetical protein VIZ65_06015 [Cellvibrionaceae bacterium]